MPLNKNPKFRSAREAAENPQLHPLIKNIQKITNSKVNQFFFLMMLLSLYSPSEANAQVTTSDILNTPMATKILSSEPNQYYDAEFSEIDGITHMFTYDDINNSIKYRVTGDTCNSIDQATPKNLTGLLSATTYDSFSIRGNEIYYKVQNGMTQYLHKGTIVRDPSTGDLSVENTSILPVNIISSYSKIVTLGGIDYLAVDTGGVQTLLYDLANFNNTIVLNINNDHGVFSGKDGGYLSVTQPTSTNYLITGNTT